jgi:signal transduction histidine kinase
MQMRARTPALPFIVVLRRIQQLRISLAAKCQLLFGAAVLMIIAAALFVPWHRIEQLTEQLNERTAAAMTEYAVADHIADHARGRISATSRPTTGPSNNGESSDFGPQPRFAMLGPRRDSSDLSKFESRAAAHFQRQADSLMYSSYYDRRDGSVGYRYARPLRFVQACAACHVAQPIAAGAQLTTAPTTLPATSPASAPTTLPVATVATDGRTLIPLASDGPLDPTKKGDESGGQLVGVVSVDFSSRIDASELRLNRVFILAAGTIAGVLAIITFYFITTRLILQPVRVLQETADKVSRGDLNIRSDISTGDEFQVLSETFNVMLTNLNASADQLRAMNKSLDLKLGQLAESNVALYESNRLKSEFLANVSHELRTPLNSILGFADLLKESFTNAPEPRTARYVANILTSGRHLLDLINDLLDLAKIEAGRMEVRSEPLSVSDMFEGLANLLRPMLEQKKLTLAITIDPDVPILQTDPGKLQQVLYNFLSNAIKFSPPEQTIELKAALEGGVDGPHTAHLQADDDGMPPPTPRLPRPHQAGEEVHEPQVRISVTDHGPGISADQQSVIFEKFRQIDGSVTRTHGGTGLGLAISKELTLLMGGTIGVKSKFGEGANFWVLLPLKVAAGPRDVRAKMVM